MRKHYFDNGKAIASFLGIIYHSALVFSGFKWLIFVEEKHSLPYLKVYTDYINLFRMPLFLFIAGYFSIYTVKKYNFKKFILNKLKRLGIPLISTLLTFSLIEKIYVFKFNHGSYPKVEILNTLIPWNINFQLSHLWFLYYIVIFSFVVYFSFYLKVPFLNFIFENNPKKYIDFVFIAFILGMLSFFCIVYIITDFHNELLSLIIMGINFPYFLLGVVTYIYWDYLESIFFNISQKRAFVLLMLLIISYILDNSISNIFSEFKIIFNTFPRYFSLILVLALLYKYLNKSNRILKYMSEASYSVYLIHQPIIVFVSYFYIRYINISNSILGFLLILLSSTLITYSIEYTLIRNTKLGSFLFSGKTRLKK